MNLEKIAEMRANGIRWRKGLDLSEHSGTWILRGPRALKNINTPEAVERSEEIQDIKRQIFVHNAKLIHGEDCYDYSQIEYVDSQTYITLILPNGGEYAIQPNKHLQGRGHKNYSNIIIDSRKRASA